MIFLEMLVRTLGVLQMGNLRPGALAFPGKV